MMVVVVLSIEKTSQDSRGFEPAVSTSSVESMPGEVNEVEIDIRRKEQKSHCKRRNLHDGVFDEAVIPRCASDKVFRVPMMPSMKSVESWEVERIMDGISIEFAQHVSAQELGHRDNDGILGIQNSVCPVPETPGRARYEKENQVHAKTLPAQPIVSDPFTNFGRSGFVKSVRIPSSGQVKVHNNCTAYTMRKEQGESCLQRVDQGKLDHCFRVPVVVVQKTCFESRKKIANGRRRSGSLNYDEISAVSRKRWSSTSFQKANVRYGYYESTKSS